MYSALTLAGISIFLFILKSLMILSHTNFPGNPVWIGISFLNSYLLYPWILWGGFQLSVLDQEKKIETSHDLTRKFDLEIQKERSQRYLLEEEIERKVREIESLKSRHLWEICSLEEEHKKLFRSATEANDEALRSLL